MNRKQTITTCAGLLLAGMAAAGFVGWLSEHKKVENLQAQMEEMKKKEMRSAVDRSISAQMEDIANEQREISDEKREEALMQTRVANEMRERSEQERQNALEAERNAVASEKKAVEATTVAEKQRGVAERQTAFAEQQRALAEEQQKNAENQRVRAEFSKRKADTLSYIALGRSLGSISNTQAQTGNTDVANLLSYASYLYTSRYGGDIYYPTVFQPLMRLSQSKVSWSEHLGAVMNLEFLPGQDNALVSVSNYGEIKLSERDGLTLHTRSLFKDSKYDFRDVIIDRTSGSIFAVSRTGHLVIIQKDLKTIKVIALDKVEHPMRLHDLNEKSMLVIGEKALALIDLKHNVVSGTKQLPFRVTIGSRKEGFPLLFDDQGKMHLVKGLDSYATQKVPVEGKVTAYCESKNTGVEAYGMSDGTIWLINKSGKKQKLIGHRSRISKMKLNGRRLYSASYDGGVNLWICDKEKVEPMTLINGNSWIMHFNFDSTKHTFWMGDIKGNLTAVNISVPDMVATIRKKLKRDLTPEEWNYYIGQNVPYESFIGIPGKEAMR